MNYGTYVDRTVQKAEMAITDTADDTTLLRKLENVSRWIDDYCHRHFYVITATRYFTALKSSGLYVPDLLSITTLKTDADGDRTYEDTWAATDYDLKPFNKFPSWELAVTPEGDYSFPAGVAKGVEIAGSWGYGSGDADGNDASATPYEDSTTTTAEALDTTETGVDLASGSAVAVGQTILVDSEQMYITAIATNTATVRRGVNGTTAAAHDTGKTVYIYRYPGPVQEACLIQTARIFRRKDAPFGMVGSAEMGYSAVIGRLDPDVRMMLDPFRCLGAA